MNRLDYLTDSFAELLAKNKRVAEINTNARLSWNETSIETLNLRMDPVKMKQFGVNALDVNQFIKDNAYPTSPVSRISLSNEIYPVYLIKEGSETFSRYDLMNEPFEKSSGGMQVLSNVAEIELKETVNAIRKENRRYVKVVGFSYYGSNQFGKKHLDKCIEEFSPMIPTGYEISQDSYNWSFSRGERDYGLILIILLSIFFI